METDSDNSQGGETRLLSDPVRRHVRKKRVRRTVERMVRSVRGTQEEEFTGAPLVGYEGREVVEEIEDYIEESPVPQSKSPGVPVRMLLVVTVLLLLMMAVLMGYDLGELLPLIKDLLKLVAVLLYGWI